MLGLCKWSSAASLLWFVYILTWYCFIQLYCMRLDLVCLQWLHSHFHCILVRLVCDSYVSRAYQFNCGLFGRSLLNLKLIDWLNYSLGSRTYIICTSDCTSEIIRLVQELKLFGWFWFARLIDWLKNWNYSLGSRNEIICKSACTSEIIRLVQELKLFAHLIARLKLIAWFKNLNYLQFWLHVGANIAWFQNWNYLIARLKLFVGFKN
jgi:hypothetical protein